uniref:Glycosyltransferase n=1 Tax=viral metagenome TaxID=1070528 RepID=A0A6C0KJB5_9ZZZZ
MTKILHITNHQGTTKNLENICVQLHISENLTTQTCNFPYYISQESANHIWEQYATRIRDFQILVFTDTTMYARPFLQNLDKHSATIIIYITNRYDWGFFGNHGDDIVLYNDLYKVASSNSRVIICADNRYDQWWAKWAGGLHFRYNDCIRLVPKIHDYGEPCSQKLFIYNRGTHVRNYVDELLCRGVQYDIYGPDYEMYIDNAHIAEYTGILHLPYQTNIQSLWENLGCGNIYFIPSKSLMTQWVLETQWYYWEERSKPREVLLMSIDLAEWYQPDLAECFVYFDDWEDLVKKIENLDRRAKKQAIRERVLQSNEDGLAKWKSIFNI